MAKFMLQWYTSLRDYLSLGLYSIIRPVLDKIEIGKHGRESKKDNQPAADSYSRWQNIQADIMESIIKQLKGTDLARMVCVCKSWKQILALHKDVWITAPDIPWLLLPHAPDQKSLSFYSMSEGRVYNMKLPKTAQGGWVCGYSEGWLAVVKGSDLDPHMFLLNPFSGEQLNLPSLVTVNPYYGDFVDKRLKHYNASTFVKQIKVFSPVGTADFMVVAAIFGFCDVLAFCKLGDKRWTIFEGGDEEEDVYSDILFYNKTLYAITEHGESLSTHTIFLTDCALELKLIPCQVDQNQEEWEDSENVPGFVEGKEIVADVYLAESIHGELLKIHHITHLAGIDSELLEDDELYHRIEEEEYMVELEEENLSIRLIFYTTKGFEIFKVNPNSGQLENLTSLGEQVLFLSAYGGSLSLPVRNIDGFRGNCIYFTVGALQVYAQRYMNISRESGVFYLEDGRIERSFPSFSFPMQLRISWFTPFLK